MQLRRTSHFVVAWWFLVRVGLKSRFGCKARRTDSCASDLRARYAATRFAWSSMQLGRSKQRKYVFPSLFLMSRGGVGPQYAPRTNASALWCSAIPASLGPHELGALSELQLEHFHRSAIGHDFRCKTFAVSVNATAYFSHQQILSV